MVEVNNNNMYKNYSKLLNAIRKIKVEDAIYTKQYDFNLSSIKQDKSKKTKNKKES